MNDGSNKFRRPASLTGSRSGNAQVEAPAAAQRTSAVDSLKVPKAVKLTENIFRDVDIVLVNELKGVYDAMLGLCGHRIRKAIGVTPWSAQGLVGDVRENPRGAIDQ